MPYLSIMLLQYKDMIYIYHPAFLSYQQYYPSLPALCWMSILSYCYIPIPQVNSISISSVSWCSCRCKQLSVTLPSVHLLVPSGFHFPSIPTIIHLHHHHSYQTLISPSYVNGFCHYTILPYVLGILRMASHGVTTQMTYFTLCLFQHTTCLFHLPCGTLVLLFFYLMSLISLVTYLFHLILFKCQVLICLDRKSVV